IGTKCAPAGCSDGAKNGAEADVDCGGGACTPCASGRHCLVPGDCAGGYCNAGSCGACPMDMVEVPHPAGTFCIDATEVTNGAYKAFLAASPDPSAQPAFCGWNTDYSPSSFYGPDDHPVVYVDWCDAYAYCEAAGKRLCGAIGGGAVATANK